MRMENHRLHICLGLLSCCIAVGGCGPNTMDGDQGTGGSGTLRVLVTDKPFPVDLLSRAEVTITRVEVRRADETDEPECSIDADCDDGMFCNGSESCDSNGLCVLGAFACASGEVCDEDADTCELCLADADCDDGYFCNGGEACGTNGLCVDGDAPCAVGEACDEDADTCGLPDGDDDDDADSNGVGSNGSPWVVVFTGEKTFDLLLLQNGQTDLLADASVPAGRFDQMRLVVTGGEVELVDERVFPLKVPSGAQSGIKLHFEFEVADGEPTELLLDVDLSRAFQPIPGGKIDDVSGIRNFKFAPSLAMRLIELVDAGSISGVVLEAGTNGLADVMVSASHDGQDVTATATDEVGAYTLIGLPAGNYDLTFSKVGYVDAAVESVQVIAGEMTTVQDVSLTPE